MTNYRVLISGGLASGGPETHVKFLCQILRKEGVAVTIAASGTNWSRGSIRQLKRLGVRVIVSPFGYGRFAIIGKLLSLLSWQFLLKRNFNVVCCIGEGRMHSVACRFVKSGGTTIYHEIVECPQQKSNAALQIGKMDYLVANSFQVANDMQSLFPQIPVRRIPFLTTDRVDPSTIHLQSNEQDPNRPLKISFFGRMVSHKRPLELVKLWRELCDQPNGFPMELHLFGGDCGGGMLPVLNHLVEDLGLQNLVFVHGAYAVEDLDSIMADIDLVVLPSLYEGLPLVLIEAMQRGIPIVSTSAGGISELSIDNPDVIVTNGTDWNDFIVGFKSMLSRIREGKIDRHRLQEWTHRRYGYDFVSAQWRAALLEPRRFFVSSGPSVCSNDVVIEG